nr:PREDICTED: histone-lysine N-methyltransferase SETMAR-like [Megachile rotundata]
MDKTKMQVIFEYEFRRELMQRRQAEMLTKYFDLQNEPRGRPESKVDDNQLKAVVEANQSETTCELAARYEVTIPTILSHLKAIGKVKKLDWWVPHELNERQQRNRFEVCCSLVSRLKGDPFLHRIVTCDEKRKLFDNRKRSAQWLDKDGAPKRVLYNIVL